jgi:hypothetical protein
MPGFIAGAARHALAALKREYRERLAACRDSAARSAVKAWYRQRKRALSASFF